MVNTSYDISTRLTFNSYGHFLQGLYHIPCRSSCAHNISSSQNQPVLVPVYTDRYNYKLPNNHRLDLNLDYTIPYKLASLKLSIGAYNVYNQSIHLLSILKLNKRQTIIQNLFQNLKSCCRLYRIFRLK